jgi:hypothetical protein
MLIWPTPIASSCEPAHGTLIILSATNSSIVIAADSGLAQNGKIISTKEDKIMPTGRDAACVLIGMMHFGHIGETQAYSVDIRSTTKTWIAQHTSSTLRELHHGLTKEFSEKLANNRVAYLDKKFGFSLFCVGFDMGFPIGLRSTFSFQTDTPPKLDSDELVFRPGLVIPLGTAKVATEILQGESDALRTFKSEAIVDKYRKARKNGTLASLTERDLISISSACLRATETRAAQEFFADAAEVAAPNRFAVIDQKHGFRWTSPPITH